MQIPLITSLKPLPDYKLEISFETNEKKIFDVTPFLEYTWYKPLTDQKYFNLVRILPDRSTVIWPDGQDIAPHNLYEDSTPTN